MSEQVNTGIHKDCGNFDPECRQCQLMAESNTGLCLLKLNPEDPCVIKKFRAAGDDFVLQTSDMEIVALRKFARDNKVALSTVQDAIDAGRLTAVVQVKQGGKLVNKLRLPDAQIEWDYTHSIERKSAESAPESGGIQNPEGDGIHWGLYKTKQEALLAEERRKALELERLQNEGCLHHANDVEAVWSVMLSRLRTRILAIPSTAAPIIASMPDRSAAKVKDLLDGLVYEALSELSQYDKDTIETQRKKRTGK